MTKIKNIVWWPNNTIWNKCRERQEKWKTVGNNFKNEKKTEKQKEVTILFANSTDKGQRTLFGLKMPAVCWPLLVECVASAAGVMFQHPQAITGVFEVRLTDVSEISTAAHMQDCIIKGLLRTKADTSQQTWGFYWDRLFFHFYASSLATSQCHNVTWLLLLHSDCDAGLHRWRHSRPSWHLFQIVLRLLLEEIILHRSMVSNCGTAIGKS